MYGVKPPHVPEPPGLAPPPGDYESWDEFMRDFEASVDGDLYRWGRRVEKAMRLAPSVAVFEALLAGQEVPVGALDPLWARRYGL